MYNVFKICEFWSRIGDKYQLKQKKKLRQLIADFNHFMRCEIDVGQLFMAYTDVINELCILLNNAHHRFKMLSK